MEVVKDEVRTIDTINTEYNAACAQLGHLSVVLKENTEAYNEFKAENTAMVNKLVTTIGDLKAEAKSLEKATV